MTDTNETKQKKSNGSPLARGIILGAALGAAAVFLSNKKNQDTVASAIKKAKKWVDEKKDEATKEVMDTVDNETEKIKKTSRRKTNQTPRRSVN